MPSLWQYIRSWFARVGSDPYYASYERSLGNIKAELDRVQATRLARARAWAAVRARFWSGFAVAYAAILAVAAYVNRQPPGSYTHSQQALRVGPAFVAPLAAWLAHRLLGGLQALLDRRSASRAKLLETKLRKQVSELKDSTRYQRTLTLLQKYDPDYSPPKPPRTPSIRGFGTNGQQQQAAAGVAPGGGLPARAAGAAVNVAGSALQGAGSRMFPVLAQLYSQAAGTLIADDPVMLGLLREAQQQSDILRQRLLQAEAQAVALLQANISLKQQMGLPTDEEQAALAGWLGLPGLPAAEGGGGAAEGGAQGMLHAEAADGVGEQAGGEAAGTAGTAGAAGTVAEAPAAPLKEEAGEGSGAGAPQTSRGGSGVSRLKRGGSRA